MAPREPKPSLAPDIRVVPANRATPEDLELIFGTRGTGATCQCQRYKLRPKESFASMPVEERQQRLRDQTDCGRPRSSRTSGLVGYLGEEPVGWCAVEPRPAYEGLVRVFRVPWDGRNEDRCDTSVWAITCLFTRAGYRRRGVSHAIAKAAVTFAQERGAAAVEAYPTVSGGSLPEELHLGSLDTFRDAGMAEVHRPTPRRAVMRVDFDR
jgi:GNAT superfamily N-acetyltransferase